jgi:hypothetical protein
MEDWFFGSWLYTQFDCFYDCLSNIHVSFPLHDIIFFTIKAPHTPNDLVNPLFVWQLIDEIIMDGLHVSCSK